MRITAVNMVNYSSNNLQKSQNKQHFNGILKLNRSDSTDDQYHGMSSSYNLDGNYHTSSSYENYTYYPFADERESNIQKVLDENNYSRDYDGGGIIHTDYRNTDRGSRLEFTEKEWYRLPKSTREKIEKMLK